MQLIKPNPYPLVFNPSFWNPIFRIFVKTPNFDKFLSTSGLGKTSFSAKELEAFAKCRTVLLDSYLAIFSAMEFSNFSVMNQFSQVSGSAD